MQWLVFHEQVELICPLAAKMTQPNAKWGGRTIGRRWRYSIASLSSTLHLTAFRVG